MIMHRVFVVRVATAVRAVTLASCARRASGRRCTPTAAVPGASLWEQPTDLRGARSLSTGRGVPRRAPDPDATYTLRRAQTHRRQSRA